MEEAKSPNLAPGAIPAPGERLLAGASAVAVTSAQQAPSTVCVDQHALTGAHKVKARKPYIITKQRERWTDEEHQRFLEAIKKYGRAWRKIEEHVGTKTAVQIRSHAQKFMNKLEKNKETASTEDGSTPGTMGETINIPPPRPKRKPMRPYPRKQQPSGADNSGSGMADVSGVNGAASQGTGIMAAQQQQQSKLSLPAAPRSSQQLGALALGLGLTSGVPGSSELQHQLLPLTQQLQQQQQQGQQLHLQLQPAVQLTPPVSGNTGMPLAEVTEATVAAVAAAASAAAAAAAAAVVAAAGQQVQAHLQAHPPQGFPFFGLPPSLLAQITLQNPALESMGWGSNPSVGHLHASRAWDGGQPQSAGNSGGNFWPQHGQQKDLYRHTHHHHHHHHHHHGLERGHQQALVGSLAEATATTTDGEDLDQVALMGGLGMGHVGTLGRGVGGGAQESRGSDGNSVVTEREGEGEDGRATADGPGSRGAARDRDTDMDIDGEVNGDGDEQEGGEAGTEREDAEVEDGEGEGEQDMGGEVEAEVEADGEEEGEGDGEEDTTGPDGGTGAEDQGAQSNRHDNKGQQDCGAQARTLADFTATAQYWQLLGILDAGRQAQAAAAAAAAASGHVHTHGLGHGHVGHGHGLREGHGAHGCGRAHSHGHSHGTRGTGSGGGAPGGQGGGRAKGHSHHKDTARERDRDRERERDRDQHNKAARSASPSCFSESQVPRHRHAPGSPPLHDNACQRGAEFVADRADGGSADGAGGGGGGGGGRGSSDTNGSDSAMRAERNDVTENREAQGSNPTNHNNGNGNGNGSGSGSQGNGNGSSGNGHSGGNGNGSSGNRNGSSGNVNGSSGNGNGSSGRNGNGHSVKDSNNPTTNGNGHSSANGTSQHHHHHHHHTHAPSLRAAPIRSPAYDAGRYPAHHETQDKHGNGASGIGARPPSSEEEDNNGLAGAPGDGGQEGGGSGSGGSGKAGSGSGNVGSGSGGSGDGPKDSLAARPTASAGRSGPNGGSAAGGGNAAGGSGGGGGAGRLRRPDGLLSLGALAGPDRPLGQVAGSAFRVPQTRGGGGSLPGPPNGGSANSQGSGGHAHGGGGELSQVQRVLAQLHAQALPLPLPTFSQLQAGQPPSFAQQAMATSSAAAQPFYAAATAAASTLQHGLPLPLLGAATRAASQQQQQQQQGQPQQGQPQQGSAPAGGAAAVSGEPGGVLAAALSRLAHGYGQGSTLQLLQTLELAPQSVLRSGTEGGIEGEAAAAVLAAAAATAAATHMGVAGASGGGGGGTSKGALPAAGAPSPAGSAGVVPAQSSAAVGLSSAYLQLMAVVKEVAAQQQQQQQQQHHAEEVQLQQHHRWASAASTAAQGGAALGLAALDALGLSGAGAAAAAAAGQAAPSRPHAATAADGPPKKRYQQLAASSLLRAVSQPEIGSSYALASATAAAAAAAGAPPGGAAGIPSPLVLALGLGPAAAGSPCDAGGSAAAAGERVEGGESSPLSTLARMAAAVADDNASEGSKAPLVRRPKPIKAHPPGHPAMLLAPVLVPAPTRSAPLPSVASLGFRGAAVAATGALPPYPQQLTHLAQAQQQVGQPLVGFAAAEDPAEAAAAALAAAAAVVPVSTASVPGADGAVAAAAAGRGHAAGGHGGAASNNVRLASVGPQEAAAPSEEPPSTSGRRRRAAIQDSGSELVGAPGAGTAAAVAAAAVAALAAARGNGGGFTSSTAATAIGPSYSSGGGSEDRGLDSLKAPGSVPPQRGQGPGHDRGQGSGSAPGHERGSNEMTLSQHADIVLPSSVRESSPAAVGGAHPQALGKRPSSSNPTGSEGPQSPPRKRSAQG